MYILWDGMRNLSTDSDTYNPPTEVINYDSFEITTTHDGETDTLTDVDLKNLYMVKEAIAAGEGFNNLL